MINVSHHGRLDRLIPIRVGRMIDSPYGFLRGTAVVMAEDVAHLPATGITPVVCGDSHFGNFGFYAALAIRCASHCSIEPECRRHPAHSRYGGQPIL